MKKLPRAQHMSAEELAGQVLMPKLDIRFRNIQSPAARKILRLVKHFQVGGIILFGGHPADIRYWSALLQRESKYPLLIGADLERGLGSVFSQGTMFPHAMAFGAAGNEALLKDFGEVLAKEARSVGINLFFGPVLDLANDPDNPIVNIRAFHASAEVVSHFAITIIETTQKFGIVCVGKHFPGHGATWQDSHTYLPEIYKSLTELEQEEWLPYRETIAAGVKGLMAGHLKVSGYDKPASLEKELVRKIIRERWEYNGVVFTDAMNMGAIQKYFSPSEQSFLPLEAGVDMLLMPPQVALTYELLRERIERDAAFRYQVEQAVERIFGLKKWIHLHKPAQDHPLRVNKIVEHPNHTGAAARVAEQSITLLHKSGRFPVNLPKIREVQHLIFTDTEFSDQPLQSFCEALKNFFERVEILNNPSLKNIQSQKLSDSAIIIVSLYFRTFAEHEQKMDWGKIGKVFRHLNLANRTVILFVFGNPYQLNNLPVECSADAVFVTYSYVQASQNAAFKTLCSFIDIGGNLPVSLKKPFDKAISFPAKSYNLEIDLAEKSEWEFVDQIISKAIEAKIFPGCVLLATQRGKVVCHRAYGHFEYDDASLVVQVDTVYDLASLTKVLATTPAIMLLVEQGELQLDNSLKYFYPEAVNDPKGNITIADLLSHQSGLPAWKPFYEELGSRVWDLGFDHAREIVKLVLNTPLEYKTGEKAIYSDLGFILLFDLVTKISGVTFDTFCRDQVFQPLGLKSLMFNPAESLHRYIPPTGTDSIREDTIRGRVNDTNCFAMGEVSGHAGLFGNALDVAAIGQLFIQKGIYNSRRLFKSSTIELFSKRFSPQISSRALGWDTPTTGGSTGNYFSEHTIGHLGYTGTSLWVDLQEEIVVVLLSNRVHPPKGSMTDPQNRMGEIRPLLHDAVMKVLLK